MHFTKLTSLILLFFFSTSMVFSQNEKSTLQGSIKDDGGEIIVGAVVMIQELRIGATSNMQGVYVLSGDFEGIYEVSVSHLGYQAFQKKITFKRGEATTLNIVLREATESLGAVVVSAKSKLREIEAMAFNVNVLNTAELKNTTLSAGEALNKVSGVRVRQSGGVGSRMNLAINGFTGKQVKVFIDGVPMDNFGSSFQLNNIPVGLAKRIEVYKGVVPIHLGSDALGGAVNIVTNQYEKSHVGLSYSYGSFNTHHSTLNATYVAKSGFIAQVQAFQNYSDNNYWMDVDVADLETGAYYPDQRVRRFHDTYHNETVIANIGVVNTSYADRLLFGVTLGQNYNEIQTGARVQGVFGAWHTEGTIIMPSLKYKKSDFIIDNLDFDLSANYNLGKEKVIDTLNRRYNWFGKYKEEESPGGERSYSLYEYENNNGVATANLNYAIDDRHSVSLSNVTSTFDRKGSDKLDRENEIYEQPRKTFKNILGIGYRFQSKNWSSSVFVKHYTQINKFAQSYNPTGVYGDIAYINRKSNFEDMGYGITGTYFFTDNFQVKASYEKSFRLPSANELFGNLVTLEGNIELDPETSDNYNLGASYWTTFNTDHQINASGNIFYRDAKDFIRARLDNNQVMQVMENLFNVTNVGVSGEVGYSYKNAFQIGANFTYQNLRNNTEYVVTNGKKTENILYRDRVPNIPYLFGNLDASYSFTSPIEKKHDVRLGYHLFYIHSFYLFWPSMGDPSKKHDLPEQFSHDLSLTYTMGKKDNLQFTFAVRNLTDNKLYDNFSLQKPGRSFSGKISYTF